MGQNIGKVPGAEADMQGAPSMDGRQYFGSDGSGL